MAIKIVIVNSFNKEDGISFIVAEIELFYHTNKINGIDSKIYAKQLGQLV